MNAEFYNMSQDQFCSDKSLPDILQNRGVEWKSILNIDKNAKFLSSDTNHYNRRFEIKQGEYGGGYFLAAVAGLTGYTNLFKMVVEDDSFEAVYNRNRLKGRFSFKFFHKGVMHIVMVDDRLPTIGGKLIFAQAVNGVYWCPLVEKAYAKFIGGYSKLTLGNTMDVLTQLTNVRSTLFSTRFMSNDALFFNLETQVRNSSIICCKSKHKNDNNGEYGRSFTITGINQNNGDYIIRLKDPKKTEEFWIGASEFKEEYDFIFYTTANNPRTKREKTYIDDFGRIEELARSADPAAVRNRSDLIDTHGLCLITTQYYRPEPPPLSYTYFN